MSRKQRRLAAKQIRKHRPSTMPSTNVAPAGAVVTILANAARCHQLGDLARAEGLYRQVLAAQPDHPDALHLLGAIGCQRGEYELAADRIERAIALRPRDPAFHSSLGNLRSAEGRHDEAIAALRRALAIRPDYAEALNNLGIAFSAAGRHDDAIAAFRRALAIRPDYAEVSVNLGTALRREGQFDQAINAYRDAIAARPDYADAYSNLGVVRVNQGRFEDAVAAFRKALDLAPDMADTHSNLGNALYDIGRLEDSLARHDEALRLRPDYLDGRSNRALPLLALGRLDEGWRAYEYRLRMPGARRPGLPSPAWDGGALDGKTIFVCAEQGIGDEILYASCLPDLIARAGHCVIECEPRLGGLFARSFPTADVFGRRRDDPTWRADAPPGDAHVMLGSLMGHFRPSLASFPDHDGYLRTDPVARECFATRLAGLGPGLKVGISWRSMRSSRWNQFYSALDDWADILALPGARFVNLQYDESGAEVGEVNECPGVHVHGFDDVDLLNDMDGVAALISALDLVIAPANTVAALAGALGTAVWLLSREPNWCMFGTGHYPWFPSASVYLRTLDMADWRPVLGRVRRDLEALVGDGAEYDAAGQRSPHPNFTRPQLIDIASTEAEVAR